MGTQSRPYWHRVVMLAMTAVIVTGCAFSKVNSRYNRFSDELLVTLRGIDLIPADVWASRSLRLQTEFSASGLLARRPELITISITASDKTSPYREDHGLSLVADGLPITLEPAGYDGTTRKGLLVEYMWVKLATPAFLAMSRAKTLTGTIGPTTFSLTPEQLADLREFATHLPPEKGYRIPGPFPVEIPGVT